MSAPEKHGVVSVVMELGEETIGTRIHGVGSVHVFVDDDRLDSHIAGDWRAFVVRVPQAMVPASPDGLARVDGVGNLIAHTRIVEPLIEHAWSSFQGKVDEPPFSGKAWWARMIGAAVDQLTGIHPSPHHVAEARRAQVDYIVGRFSNDRRLTPAAIAQAIGVSRRTLYELAEPRFGGISEYIRTARAIRASSMLADVSARQLTATEIAHAAGFSSAKHMARALQATSGLSPATLRPESAQAGGSSEPGPEHRRGEPPRIGNFVADDHPGDLATA